MSRHADVTMKWADGEHTFKLAVRQLEELEIKLRIDMFTLHERIRKVRFYHSDCREVLRVGLIGGGLDPLDSLRLVEMYCDERPLIENMTPALLVLEAALFLTAEEREAEAKKKAEAEDQARNPTTADFPSGSSMEMVQ